MRLYGLGKMDFDLRHLEIFCKVVELKSFSKAAKAVYLAQASVSERVANLEKAVGTRLLDRLGRQVVPTKAGELLYEKALRLLEMKKGISQELEDFLGIKKGTVHIGGSTIPGEYILPQLLGKFREKHPGIIVTLSISDSGQIQEKVLNGVIELGVIGVKPKEKNLVSRALWEDELVLAVPSSHALSDKEVVTIDDILELPFILREQGSGTLKIFEDYLRRYVSEGINALNLVTRLGSSTSVKEGIKAGIGVSIISLRAIRTEMEANIIKALRIKDVKIKREFYLIRDKRREISPLGRTLFNFLVENRIQ